MELVGLFVDFAVPTIAAVGSGLVAYSLTGGEEENIKSIPGEIATIHNFNSDEMLTTEESGSGFTNNSFGEEIKKNDDEIARAFIQQGAEIRMETSLSNIDDELRSLQTLSSSIVGKVDLLSQAQPIWATQMLDKLNELSNTVRELQKKVDLKDNDTAESPIISPAERLREIIDEAMFGFYHGIGDDIANLPVTAEWIVDPKFERREELAPSIGPACDMLLMFIKNIQRNPETPRFRKIPTNNANYRTLLAAAPGHKRILRSIGFVLKGSAWEWDWIPEAQTPPLVSAFVSKNDALALLTHAVDRLQQIRTNRFDLVSPPSSSTDLNKSSNNDATSAEAAGTIPVTEATKFPEEIVAVAALPVSSVLSTNMAPISVPEKCEADNIESL